MTWPQIVAALTTPVTQDEYVAEGSAVGITDDVFHGTLDEIHAVNACMAGCKPEYMPILIAMTKAMGGSDFRRTLQSTHAWVPYSWLNGPVARQLGISSGQGEINAEANTSLSRFLALALMNLAGYYVGQNRMGTFGYLQPWCLVEDEEACRRVGWQTWNEQQGLDINANSVTLSSAILPSFGGVGGGSTWRPRPSTPST